MVVLPVTMEKYRCLDEDDPLSPEIRKVYDSEESIEEEMLQKSEGKPAGAQVSEGPDVEFRDQLKVRPKSRQEVPSWQRSYEAEFSDDDSSIESPGPSNSTFNIVLSDTQQADLNQAFQHLSHGAAAMPTQNAFVHFQTIGMQMRRVLLFAEEAQMDEAACTLQQWLRFFECIAQSEGGDFLLPILISQTMTALKSHENRDFIVDMFHKMDVVGTGSIQCGAASQFFTAMDAPAEFILRYELMEDMCGDGDERDQVDMDAWLQIFESLFANEGTCDWLVAKFNDSPEECPQPEACPHSVFESEAS